MEHSEFVVGEHFWCGDRLWRCTDIGRRVIVAIKLDDVETITMVVQNGIILEDELHRTLTYEEADTQGWFNGPPYAIAEMVFDENDIDGCYKAVVVRDLPENFLDGLPEEDQAAIRKAIGKPVRLVGYDEADRRELEFRDDDGDIHAIWIDVDSVEPWK